MTTAWLLSLIPMLLLLTISIVVRLHCRSWTQPGAYFCLAVMIYFLIPLIVAPDFYFSPGAMWWIFASVLVFLSGSMMPTYVPNRTSASRVYGGKDSIDKDTESIITHTSRTRLLPRIEWVLFISVILGVLSPILLLLIYGKSIGSFLSLKGIVDVGSEFSVLRYSGNYRTALLVQALLPFVYASPILGGMLFAVRNNKKQLVLVILAFSPPLLTFLTHTARAAILVSFVLFVAGYLACLALVGRSSNFRLFSKKKLPAYIAIVLVLLVALAFGDIARRGQILTFSGINDALRSPRAGSYIFGHAPAFSLWFKTAWNEKEEISYGTATFEGVFNALGLKGMVKVDSGEEIAISSTARTNIYSMFRQFAQDFTFSGSLLFLFILGLIAGLLYNKVGNGSLLLMPLLIAVYALLGMQLTPIFRFTSTVIAILIIQVYVIAVWLFQRRAESQVEC
jgi:oligosaccharide repeat unit polymerase